MAFTTSKGLSAMKQIVAEKKQQQEEFGSRMNYLKLEDGAKKRIRFLVDEDGLLSLKYHNVTLKVNGKKQYRKYACTEDETCLLCKCEDKDIKKVSYRFRIPVLDIEADEVAIWEGGVKVAQQLIDVFDEYGTLTDRDYKLSRTGTGLGTTYNLMPTDKAERDISKYEIPENYGLVPSLEEQEKVLKLLEEGEEGAGTAGTQED